MYRLIVIAATVLAGALVLDVASQPATLSSRIGAAPVVVELFTSQGCSSCPPADELLGRIARDPALHGRVIPLAFHVDYWNYLGWRDPFSSAEWSQRQREYVKVFDLTGPYTPQAVVNGSHQLVGSYEKDMFDAIEQASRRKSIASIAIRDGLAIVDAPRELDLIAFTTENEQTTNVGRGENEGRKLTEYAIVRKLTRMGTVHGHTERELPPGANVVVLQDTRTKEIVAAAER